MDAAVRGILREANGALTTDRADVYKLWDSARALGRHLRAVRASVLQAATALGIELPTREDDDASDGDGDGDGDARGRARARANAMPPPRLRERGGTGSRTATTAGGGGGGGVTLPLDGIATTTDDGGGDDDDDDGEKEVNDITVMAPPRATAGHAGYLRRGGGRPNANAARNRNNRGGGGAVSVSTAPTKVYTAVGLAANARVVAPKPPPPPNAAAAAGRSDEDATTTAPRATAAAPPPKRRSVRKRSSEKLESNGGNGGGGRNARKRAKTTSSSSLSSSSDDDASDSDGAVSETSDADADEEEDTPRLTQSEESEIISDISRRRMADAKRNPGDRACALCRKPLAGTPPAQIECEFTPGAKKGDITLAHLDCFLYAPRSCHDDDVVLEDGSYMAKGILKESERAKRLKCYACKKTGACTGCYYPRCQWSFHIPCARRFSTKVKGEALPQECIFIEQDERAAPGTPEGENRLFCPRHRHHSVLGGGGGRSQRQPTATQPPRATVKSSPAAPPPSEIHREDREASPRRPQPRPRPQQHQQSPRRQKFAIRSSPFAFPVNDEDDELMNTSEEEEEDAPGPPPPRNDDDDDAMEEEDPAGDIAAELVRDVARAATTEAEATEREDDDDVEHVGSIPPPSSQPRVDGIEFLTDLEFVAPTQQAPPTPPPPQMPEEEEEEEEDGEGPLEKTIRRISASMSQPKPVARELSQAAASPTRAPANASPVQSQSPAAAPVQPPPQPQHRSYHAVRKCAVVLTPSKLPGAAGATTTTTTAAATPLRQLRANPPASRTLDAPAPRPTNAMAYADIVRGGASATGGGGGGGNETTAETAAAAAWTTAAPIQSTESGEIRYEYPAS